MVVDTSAIVAILLDEPEAKMFLQKMNEASSLSMSPVSLVETSLVLMRGSRPGLEAKLDGFLQRAGIRLMPVDLLQASLAREAFRQFGKGRHKAALNFGDCFSYALAKALREALLFKGNDFSQTDVERA